MFNVLKSIIILLPFVVFSSCDGQVESKKKDDGQIITKINDTLFKVVEFYPDKQKKEEYYVDKEGKLNGKYYTWTKKGIKLTEWNFVKGEKHGLQLDWWATGQKSSIENYYYGKRNGIKESYTESGEFISEEKYVMGEMISRRVADDYYKPLPEMLKIFTDLGLDSITACKILKDDLSGYIITTDSGMVVKYDANVANKISKMKLDIDSIKSERHIKTIKPPSTKEK